MADIATVISVRDRSGQPSEFYVHYHDFDRRLDEWVPISRLELVGFRKAIVGGSGYLLDSHEQGRKVTRNMKRKVTVS